MWCNRVLLICAWLGSTPAAANVACPSVLHGHSLREIGMFDGPPSQMAELVPDDTAWNTQTKPKVGTEGKPAFYVQCRYRNTAEAITVPVPLDIKRCDLPAGRLRVVCH